MAVAHLFYFLSAEFLKMIFPADDQGPELQCLLKAKEDLS